MSTKHKPLRIAVSHGYLVTTSLPDGIDINARCLAKIEPNADASVQAWCDRANAYPRLVQSLKSAIASLAKSNHPYSLDGFEELLRELGEE